MKLKYLICLIIASSLASFAFAEECVITGCNSEKCSDMAEPHFGLCVWQPEYECYHQYGVCSKSIEGICAWEEYQELEQCITKLKQDIEGSGAIQQPPVYRP